MSGRCLIQGERYTWHEKERCTDCKWDKMVRHGTDETGDWRTANLLRTYRGWWPTYRMFGLFAIILSSTSPCWLGTSQPTHCLCPFNAKIGADNTGYEDTIGTQGLGQMIENGERFADMCAVNQMVTGGSIFSHKRIHKATWRSPDHVTENQIDHIILNQPEV